MTLGLARGTVLVAPYDPAWAEEFARERARLLGALGLPLRIEHVGSTSVPGLEAKPVIDIVAGRPAESEPEPYVAALVGAGYEHRGENGIPGRHYFVRESDAGLRTHHLHLVALDGDLWRSHLAFRDHLRETPAAVFAYAALKRYLASRHPDDRAAYTEAKSGFIGEVLRTVLPREVPP